MHFVVYRRERIRGVGVILFGQLKSGWKSWAVDMDDEGIIRVGA